MFALRGMRRRNEAVRFFPDGRHVAAVGTEPGMTASGVVVWDVDL